MSTIDLPPNQQLAKGDRWPVVGETSPRIDDAPWCIRIDGEVLAAREYKLDELACAVQVKRIVDVHCVTRWSKLRMEFTGIPLSDLIHDSSGAPIWNQNATHLSFVARSERGHSTSLPLAEVIQLEPLIALCAEGSPLETEHGGPVRMVVPGKYFYKSVKWLERIEFLNGDRLGYWESEAGYHNGADPWKEERYIAATIGKQQASRMIQERDFRGRDLLSLQASRLNLEFLNAAGALLRNADFRHSKLREANFTGANLSNAHLEFADLRGANFQGADLEGANFCGADLRGADLRQTSLFGASFSDVGRDGEVSRPSVVDTATRFDVQGQDLLTPAQRSLLEAFGSD